VGPDLVGQTEEELGMFRAIALVVLVIAPIHAASAAACMTKSEAREAYSTSYLYWHGANHCWDATPNGRRDTATATTATPRHHFVRPHRDEDQVARAQPQQTARTQPQPTMQEQPQPAMQTQPQPEGSAPLPLELTSADLIRVGNTMRIEELESTLKDRWPDTNMEFQAKPAFIVSAAADAEPLVPVRVVMLSIGVILVICTVLEVAFGAKIAQRRIDRYT
jgi:hypothetical protein